MGLSFYSNMADTCRTLTVVPAAPGHMAAVAALELNGVCEYKKYTASNDFRSNRSASSKVVQMLDTLARYGASVYVQDRTQMEDMGGGLYELKPHDHRLLLFLAGVTWIVTSARQKPKGQKKVQDAWIEEGQRRKALYLSLLSQKKVTTL